MPKPPPLLSGQCIIQCKSSETGLVNKSRIKDDFDRKRKQTPESHISYLLITNGLFSDEAKKYMRQLRKEGWEIDWIENTIIT